MFEGGQLLELLLREGGQQRADALERNVQFFGDLVVHRVGRHDQLAFQRAGFGVVTGVDDRTVGLGTVAAEIFILLDDGHVQFVLGQFPCKSAADSACANNDNVCLFHT